MTYLEESFIVAKGGKSLENHRDRFLIPLRRTDFFAHE